MNAGTRLTVTVSVAATTKRVSDSPASEDIGELVGCGVTAALVLSTVTVHRSVVVASASLDGDIVTVTGASVTVVAGGDLVTVSTKVSGVGAAVEVGPPTSTTWYVTGEFGFGSAFALRTRQAVAMRAEERILLNVISGIFWRLCTGRSPFTRLCNGGVLLGGLGVLATASFKVGGAVAGEEKLMLGGELQG